MFTLFGALVVLNLSFTSIYYAILHRHLPTIVSLQHFADAKKQYNSVFSYSNYDVGEVPIIGFASEGKDRLIQTDNLQSVIVLGYICGAKLILTNEQYNIAF